MSPFEKESGRTNTGSQRYCDSFAGVFIDEDGNLITNRVIKQVNER